MDDGQITEFLKSQRADGSWKPVTKLPKKERKEIKTRIVVGNAVHQAGLDSRYSGHYRRFKYRTAGSELEGRGVDAAYRNHGIQPALRRALTENTRASTTHKNIEYGSSVGPVMERKIDAGLRPELVAGLKHPVVFHRGRLRGAYAAAAPHHVAVGNKARVVISQLVDGRGRFHSAYNPSGSFDEMVNHELGHAMLHNQSPYRFEDEYGAIKFLAADGEEARADAIGVKGRGLYQREDGWQDDDVIDELERTREDRDTAYFKHKVKRARRYNEVHRRVQDAYYRDANGRFTSKEKAVSGVAKNKKRGNKVAGGIGGLSGYAAYGQISRAQRAHKDAKYNDEVALNRAKIAGGHGRDAALHHKLARAYYGFAEQTRMSPDTNHRYEHYKATGDNWAASAHGYADDIKRWHGKVREAKGAAQEMRALRNGHLLAAGGIAAAGLGVGALAGHAVNRFDEKKHRRDHGKFAPTGAHMSNVEKALEILSKSQLQNGSYVPASELSPVARKKQRVELIHHKIHGTSRFQGNSKNDPGGRSLNEVYTDHVANKGLPAAMREQLRQSKVHKNVQYGSSVDAHGESTIDSLLNAKLLKSAKHPISFHVTRDFPDGGIGYIGAAVGSHQTTGHIGRVLVHPEALISDGVGFPNEKPLSIGDYLNHEVVHARKHNKNPMGLRDPHTGTLPPHRVMGEEARADGQAIHGRGAYQRGGIITDPDKLNGIIRDHHLDPDDPQVAAGIRANNHYHDVHTRVQRAFGTTEEAGGSLRGQGQMLVGRHLTKGTLFAAGAVGAVGAGMAIHHMWDESKHHRSHGKFAPGGSMSTVEKNLKQLKGKTTSALNNLHITPQQARTAGALGQIGGSAGALGGAAIGAGVGAFAHKPATGAGIGAAIGGSLGGGGGAAAGLYAGRPRKKIAKSFDETKHKRDDSGKFLAGAALAAGAVGGGTGGAMSMVGHHSAKTFERKTGERVNVANHYRRLSQTTKGEESINHLRRSIGERASAISMQTGAEAGRGLREAGGRVALASGGLMVGGLAAAALKHRHDEMVGKSFLHPQPETKRKVAEGGLAGASVADAVGAKSAWNETRNAVKPVTEGLKTGEKVKTLASYAGKKAAFPIVAAGIGATALAEHELKEKPVSKSADEIFANAREIAKFEQETKRGAQTGAKIGGAVGALSGGAGGHMLATATGGSRALGAATGAARGGVKLGLGAAAVGAGVGALKARKRIKNEGVEKSTSAVQTWRESKVEKTKSVDELFANARAATVEKGFAQIGEKLAEGTKAVTGAVKDPVNRAAVRDTASFHTTQAADKWKGLSKPKKLAIGGGAGALAAGAALKPSKSKY